MKQLGRKLRAAGLFFIALLSDGEFRAHFWTEPKELWEWFLHFFGVHQEDCDTGGVCDITGFPIY